MLTPLRSPAAVWTILSLCFLYYFFILSPAQEFKKQVFLGPPLNSSHGPFVDPNLLFEFSYPKPLGSSYTRTLVIGHRRVESIDWISEVLPDLHVAAYVVDNQQAPLHPPKNKGREAMVYLTYIIDHYDTLPDIVLFLHSSRNAWHNNVFHDRDSVQMIRAMRDDHIAREGYFNVRCEHNPGCPDWLHLDRPEGDFDKVFKPEERSFTPQIWKEIWGNTSRVPQTLSQPCCAQFAVTGERIRLNPLATYIHIRDWLLHTHIPDHDSGRVMEYTWHYLFTRLYENCPPINKCACAGYGICFGSQAKMQEWLDMFYDREHRELDIKQMEGDDASAKALVRAGGGDEVMREREKKLEEYRGKVRELTGELGRIKDEAVKRGMDEQNIALERGRRVH